MKITSSQKESQTFSHTLTPNPKLSQQYKKLIEQKGESLNINLNPIQSNQLHEPYLTPRTSNNSLGIDKDKLYETFVLFHSFMNMTQTNNSPHTYFHPYSKHWNDSNKKTSTNLQVKIDQISICKTEEDHQNKETAPSNIAEPQSLPKNSKNNYDDIPIKSINGNFIDLVERNLLIDQADDNKNSDNKNKIIIQREKTPTIPKMHKTYQKPFYASTLTEEPIPKMKFKQTATSRQRYALYKTKDKKNEKETPRRIMSNKKYEQMSKSLRKTNTDFHPYMTLTTEDIAIQKKLDKSGAKDDEDENKTLEKEKPMDIPGSSENKSSEKNDDINLVNNTDKEEKTHLKNEESFHIITDINAKTKQTIPSNQSNDAFSNENNDEDNECQHSDSKDEKQTMNQKEEQVPNQIDFSNNNTKNDLNNIQSIEIEPIQLNTIPISSKLFQPTPIHNQRHFTENDSDQKLQSLNKEIQLFQEERRQILLLKEEYENLHLRLKKELSELTIQKTKFGKWKDEEVKRIQTEKKNNDKEKKAMNDLKKENQILKTNEQNHKNQIEKLLLQIKELKKEKENINQLTINQTKNPNTSSSLSKTQFINNPPNSQRNYTINTTKLLKQQIPKDISFSTPSQGTSISNYNTNISKKNAPKPIHQQQQIAFNYSLMKKENYDLTFPEEHSNKNYNLIKEEKGSDGKEIKWYTNDKKEIIFPSGVRKEIYSDGFQIVSFANGDIKQIHKNGKTVYYFKEAKTIQTCFDSGLQVFKFQNGQIEKHFSDGKKEIFFVDGSYRIIKNDGSEETYFSDGTIQKIDCNKVVTFETTSTSKEMQSIK